MYSSTTGSGGSTAVGRYAGRSNTGGYVQNPVISLTNSVWGVANGIIGIANLASSNVTQVYAAANTLYTSANNFMQRMSALADTYGNIFG